MQKISSPAEYSGEVKPDNNGVVELSNHNLKQFPHLDPNSGIKIINFRNNPIYSLQSLPTIQTLEELHLDGTKLLSFEGAAEQPNLKVITLDSSPVCKCNFLPFMCYIIFGEKLQKINDTFLNDLEISACNQIKERIIKYLREGWVMYSYIPLCIYNFRTKETKNLNAEQVRIQPLQELPTLTSIPSVPVKNIPLLNDDSSSSSSIRKRKGNHRKQRTEKISYTRTSSISESDDDTTLFATIDFSSDTLQSSDSDSSPIYINRRPEAVQTRQQQEPLILGKDPLLNGLESPKPNLRPTQEPKKEPPSLDTILQLDNNDKKTIDNIGIGQENTQQNLKEQIFPVVSNKMDSKKELLSPQSPKLKKKKENDGGEKVDDNEFLQMSPKTATYSSTIASSPHNFDSHEAFFTLPTLGAEINVLNEKKKKKKRKHNKRPHNKKSKNASQKTSPPNLAVPQIIQLAKPEPIEQEKPQEPPEVVPETPKVTPSRKKKNKRKPKKEKDPKRKSKGEKKETKTLPKAPPLSPSATPHVITKADSSHSSELDMTKKPQNNEPNSIPEEKVSPPIAKSENAESPSKRKKKKRIVKKKAGFTFGGQKNQPHPFLDPDIHTEVFETDDDSEHDDDPPVFKKVDFFKLIGIEPDSGDEYLSQDESSESEEEEDITGDSNIIDKLKEQGRQKFYQIRTPETSTTDEMEKFVNGYVRESLRNM